MKRLLQFAFAAMMLFAACEKDKEVTSDDTFGKVPQTGAIFCKHYIDSYIDVDTMEVRQYTYYEKKPVIRVSIGGFEYDYRGLSGMGNYARKVQAEDFVYDGGVGSLPSGYVPKYDSTAVLPVDQDVLAAMIKKNLAVFDSISKRIGDTCFNQISVPFMHSVANDTIMGIDVVCNENFNETHKVGSSVADIVDFYGSSPYYYIRNGYRNTQTGGYTKIMKDYGLGIDSELAMCRITDIAAANVKFFDYHFYLVFDKLPTKSGIYTFEVTMKLSKNTLKNTVTMEF
ncbi:MAG: hypothetical protein J6X05_06765 [Bacteroidales bacterium]|nr:hypothetical protein [Bacteroidales bacterium]